MKFPIASYVTGLALCLGAWVFVQVSCVPPKDEELFPAGSAFSCEDKIQNRDEYKVDCGGTFCSPCNNLNKAVFVEVDSTWLADSVKSAARFWTAQYVLLTYGNGLIEVKAIDTMNHGDPYFMSLTFNIRADYERGIYEVDNLATNEKFVNNPQGGGGGNVELEHGVITVTSVDHVNKLISGEFEFISKPHKTDLYRIGFYQGTFTDIPLTEPD